MECECKKLKTFFIKCPDLEVEVKKTTCPFCKKTESISWIGKQKEKQCISSNNKN